MEKRFLASGCVLSALLAACGGGGGGTSGGGIGVPPPTNPPSITNASGSLVDDTSGAAIAGVNVVLYPWTAGSTTIVAQTTTDSAGHFTLSNVANGHYLLVIGSNLATDTTYTTVHDNVTLSGGNQTLVAPTLPAMFGYTPPAWETNGTYRLSHIDATKELPCFQRFNADRTTASQPAVPLDEWVMENVRTNNANTVSSAPTLPKYISSQNGFESSGTAGCSAMIDFQFPPPSTRSAADPRVSWAGAAVIFGTTSYVGTVEAPFDPRGYADPTYGPWP